MSPPRPRILITGIGLRGPSIDSAAGLWSLLQETRPPSPRPVRTFPNSGDVLGFSVDIPPGDSTSRLERLAIAACDDAVRDAGLTEDDMLSAGVYFGTTHGAVDLFEASVDARSRSIQLYGTSELLAERHGCFGPNQVYSTACSASLNALGLAFETLRDGRADLMLVGGGEIFSDVAMASFVRLGGLDPECCRPFDRQRQGAVFGEGAGFLVLETETSLRARAPDRAAYCSIAGFGWSCDAHHATAPEASGRALRLAADDALARSAPPSKQLDCVIPHGTGTRLNDEVEAKVIMTLLQSGQEDAPVLPTKAFIGHGAGAAGVFSCATAALVCRHQMVPSAANCPDPEYPLNLAGQNPGRPITDVLVNAYAFGGNNTSLLLRAL